MPQGERAGAPRWADLTERVRQVATACADASLERLRIVDGDVEIEVRRGVAARRAAAPPETVEEPVGAVSLNGAGDHSPEPAFVHSDVVGIVRLSHPAVAEGSVIDGERELAYVESLGVRNPVSSGGPGRVVAVLVQEGEPVEYGQPLFAIER